MAAQGSKSGSKGARATRSNYIGPANSFILQPTSEEELRAVCRIEQWWIRVRGRRIFRLLKEAVCAAEHSLTYEVLRKLSPLEAELLKDPAIRARIKFRFSGPEFPPFILFKIFTSTQSDGAGGVCYLSSRKMIKPASEAAEDARRQMGNRVFYDQMYRDVCHQQVLGVTDEVDVTTMKEYMQYVSNMDETPAGLGGKDNSWRRLSLAALPRHSALANLVSFLEERGRGRESLGLLTASLTQPSQREQVATIKTVSSHSNRKMAATPGSSKDGGRRSRQAKHRADKMRKLYTSGDVEAEKEEVEDDDWDQEADDLYQWTQKLSFEDVT